MSRSFTFFSILLILLGLVISFWNWVFGLPLFLFGAFLLAFTKLRLISKLLWVFMPVIVFYAIGWILRFELNKATPETYLIPRSQLGKFRVVYGENCGINPEIKDGRRLLKIPSDGILLVQSKLEQGWLDQKFYLVAPNGAKELIAVNGRKENNSQPNVFISGPTSVGFYTDDTIDKTERLEYDFVDFEISRKDTISHSHDTEIKRLDSLTKVKIMKCRANNH